MDRLPGIHAAARGADSAPSRGRVPEAGGNWVMRKRRFPILGAQSLRFEWAQGGGETPMAGRYTKIEELSAAPWADPGVRRTSRGRASRGPARPCTRRPAGGGRATCGTRSPRPHVRPRPLVSFGGRQVQGGGVRWCPARQSRASGSSDGSNDSDGGLVLRSEVALRYFAE